MALLTVALLLLMSLKGSALTPDAADDQSAADFYEIGDVCKECTQIFELLTDLLANPTLQSEILNRITSLCDHLPAPAATAMICKQEVKKVVPMAIGFIAVYLKPAHICKQVGLCRSGGEEVIFDDFMEETLQVTVTNENGKATPQCTFCILLVKTLDDVLPKERTEDAVVQFLEKTCQLLPPDYQEQCETVIDKFSKTVMDAILSFATPQTVCSLLQLCKGRETLPADPCTLPTYRCRDVQTALKCGSFFYCQRRSWKPLKSNPV